MHLADTPGGSLNQENISNTTTDCYSYLALKYYGDLIEHDKWSTFLNHNKRPFRMAWRAVPGTWCGPLSGIAPAPQTCALKEVKAGQGNKVIALLEES